MRKFLILALCLIYLSRVSAQVGSIEGIIADSMEVLTGASVSLAGTTLGAITDLDGHFLISNVPAGKWTLRASFIGYQKYELPVTIHEGENLRMGKLRLNLETRSTKEVTVKAQSRKGSEIQAIDLTKNSQKIITVISSENIKKLPDKNAADALKRIAGVAIQNNKGEGGYVSLRGTPTDWTSTLLNGDRIPVADEENTSRSFEFEVLPADLVERIDVTRTVTPDLEGDNVGGSINFILKEPVDKRTFIFNIAGGTDLLSQKPSGNLNLTWGDVSKNKKFRYVLNTSLRGRYYAADAFTLIYGSNFNHSINRYELKDYTGNRLNFGFNGGFDYAFTPKVKLGMRSMVGVMQDNKNQNKFSYTYASGENRTVQPQFIHGILNRELYGGDIHAEISPNEKWKINLKYSGYFNRFYYGRYPYKTDDPRNGYFTLRFINTDPTGDYNDLIPIDPYGKAIGANDPNAVFAKVLDVDNPYRNIAGSPYQNADHFTAVKPQFNLPITDSNVNLYKAQSETNYTYEADPFVFQADIKHDINSKVSIQFGVKSRYKFGERRLGFHWWTINPNNGLNRDILSLSEFQTQPNRWNGFLSEYGSKYGYIVMPNMTEDQIGKFISQVESRSGVPMIDHYVDKFNEEYYYWVGASYDYKEAQNAAYFMADAKVGKVQIVGGIRFEHTFMDEHALDLRLDTSVLAVNPRSDDTSVLQSYHPTFDAYTHIRYLAILPNININWTFRDDMGLRAAVSRTFHRQNFQETKPGAPLIKYQDFLAIKGNPNLKPSYAYNLDLSYQYFWGSKGIITFSVYGKYIVDHIFVATTNSIDDITYFVAKTYQNAASSWVCGAELELRKRFDFLPGGLSGLGVNANVTYSVSRMKIPGRAASQPMAEQSPLLYNVGLSYEKYGVRTAIALNYNSPYLLDVNLATLPNTSTGELLHKDQDFDVFLGEQYSLDFQFSYEFKKHFAVYLEANNLLDWGYKTYVGTPDRPLRVEYYKQRGQIGFKYEL